ncbi:MAG: cell division protein FtsZ [Bacteriovoracaceae bacterium]|nr:cell division protein FtsZ [Bacteriovoracaceae bacterium]
MFEISDENNGSFNDGARIKVIGIGGGGCNAVNTMIKAGLSGVEYIVANTDSQALNSSLAPTKVQLGADITKGLGAGANPEIGRKAALDEYEKLSEVIQDSDMVFITAGMGGGTGTGAAPVIAKLAKELGALTVGVVTKPFIFEGKKRFRQAEAGIHVLEENVDSLITIPNQRLLYLAGESLSLVDTFKKADEVLLNAVRGISDLINNTGHINADFADVKTVMANKGLSLMGTGVCTGPDRAVKAATDAISSPLLEDISIDGATGIIINITGNEAMTMHETNEAVTLIMEAADDDAEIIFGTVIDENMEEEIKVTVVATGLHGQERATSKNIRKNVEVKHEIEHNSELSKPTSWAPEEPRSERVVAEEQPAPVAKQDVLARPRPMPEEPVMARTPEVREQRRVEPEAAVERPKEDSDLVRSIKAAASNYEQSKAPAPREERVNTNPGASRAKSIAEKLGFINFDEEELDTPSYLRKDEVKPDDKSFNL